MSSIPDDGDMRLWKNAVMLLVRMFITMIAGSILRGLNRMCVMLRYTVPMVWLVVWQRLAF